MNSCRLVGWKREGGIAPQKQQQLLRPWRPDRPAHSPGRPDTGQRSGASQVQRPETQWRPVYLRSRRPSRAGCPAGPGRWEDSGPPQTCAGAEAERWPSAKHLPRVGTASGRPSTTYPQSRGGAGTADREKLHYYQPTRARPRIELELCAQRASRPPNYKLASNPAPKGQDLTSNCQLLSFLFRENQICSPDQLHRTPPPSG